MTPLVSIIIDNYNYAKFLPAAIESAIHQTYSPVEILVVDDGSTDESREIIARYQSSIVPILKQNGGNNSAINAGVKHSQGKIICFLDADDFLYPDKVARVVEVFEKEPGEPKPMLVHHLLEVWDESRNKKTGQFKGKIHRSPYNLYDHAKRYRFIPFETGPTSSISINRALADLLFPLPEHRVKMWADDFIVLGASLVSELRSLNSGLGGYRVHGGNLWFNLDRTKTYESIEILEKYLNEKLTANNRLPIISFRHSMYFWEQLAKEKHWLTLSGHMVRLLVVQRDKLTLKFIYDTVQLIFNKNLRKYVIFRWIAESTTALRHGNGAQSKKRFTSV
jgi:glycosyltransferase involved in cell wall biosynthesis